ncbi:hypothetical protein HK101_001656 [Irineochytrium annulatum]|nr:hypothetical protein HK101_001656 [Irineochytrium annulatum]
MRTFSTSGSTSSSLSAIFDDVPHQNVAAEGGGMPQDVASSDFQQLPTLLRMPVSSSPPASPVVQQQRSAFSHQYGQAHSFDDLHHSAMTRFAALSHPATTVQPAASFPAASVPVRHYSTSSLFQIEADVEQKMDTFSASPRVLSAHATAAAGHQQLAMPSQHLPWQAAHSHHHHHQRTLSTSSNASMTAIATSQPLPAGYMTSPVSLPSSPYMASPHTRAPTPPLPTYRPCNKRFKSTQSLRHHVRLHRLPRDKVCGDCGKAFIRQQDLARHASIHLGPDEYLFRCGCGKGFRRRDGIVGHVKANTCGAPVMPPVKRRGVKGPPGAAGSVGPYGVAGGIGYGVDGGVVGDSGYVGQQVGYVTGSVMGLELQ